MPFDSASQDIVDFVKISDKPSLKSLSYVLRHSETWPEDFEWDYRDCITCAMGLASQLWNKVQTHTLSMSLEFDMSHLSTYRIFIELDRVLKKPANKITPIDVADAIDAYLADNQ